MDISSSLDEEDILVTPSGVTVVPIGTAGSTTYGYRIAALNASGTTLASTTVTTTTGNASLSGTNYNLVSWGAVNGATSYKIYGRTSGSELLMRTVSEPTNTYNDTGADSPSGALPGSNTTSANTITLNSFTIDQSMVGKIGLANNYLQINATTLNIGQQSSSVQATGSQRIHLQGTYTTVNIFDTCQGSADTGLPPVCFGPGTTITTMFVKSGQVGVAILTPVETATITTLNITQSDVATSTPSVSYGLVTSTTLNIEAGTLQSRATATCTTVNIVGGVYRVLGTSAHTTINVESGKLIYNGTGTITNLNVYNATADFSNDGRPKTITTLNLYAGAKLNLNTGVKGSVTTTNGVKINGTDIGGVSLQVGNDRTLSLS